MQLMAPMLLKIILILGSLETYISLGDLWKLYAEYYAMQRYDEIYSQISIQCI